MTRLVKTKLLSSEKINIKNYFINYFRDETLIGFYFVSHNIISHNIKLNYQYTNNM